MKKFACILLSLIMILTFGVAVFADTPSQDDADIDSDDIFGDQPLNGGEVDDGNLGAGDIFGNPVISAENKTAYQGRTVTVDLVIEENPGFTDMTITVTGEDIAVVSVANGAKGTATVDNGKVVITSDEEIDEDICIAKVTLSVGDDLGDVNVALSIFAKNGNKNVAVEGSDFTITVIEAGAIWGDVNGDSSCDVDDLAQLKLLLAGAIDQTSPTIVNPDVNLDTEVDVEDLAQLKLFLSGATIA